jgi:hypothetical protein
MSNTQPTVPDPDVSPMVAANTATIVPDSEEEQRRRQIEKNQALIQLLRSWREGDPEEQRETWEYLRKALDEDETAEAVAMKSKGDHMMSSSHPSIPDPDVSSTGAANTTTVVPDSEEEQRRRQIEKNQALIQLLDSWSMGDEQEQRETWEYLRKALDEDRLSDRKLFP